MSFVKSSAYQHALCMDLKQDEFSYAIVNKSSKSVVDFQHFDIADYSRESLDKLIAGELFRYDFADFILTCGSLRNTLVPTTIFNASKPAELFKFNYSAPIDNLDYNRIPELDIVNIYELPIWVKAAFVIRCPRVKMVHRSTVLLKGVFNQPTFHQKIHLFIEKDSFYLFITERSKLTFFNRFDFLNAADIIYHLLFVLQQKEIDVETIDLLLYGVGNDWALLPEFKTFLKNAPKVSEKKEQGEYFIHSNQLLCV